jgi:hypothetical protein
MTWQYATMFFQKNMLGNYFILLEYREKRHKEVEQMILLFYTSFRVIGIFNNRPSTPI